MNIGPAGASAGPWLPHPAAGHREGWRGLKQLALWLGRARVCLLMGSLAALAACAPQQNMTELAAQLAAQSPPPAFSPMVLPDGSGPTASARAEAARDAQGFAACEVAIQAAEAEQVVPRGLLMSIAKVESGRADPSAGGKIRPWPWSINVDGQSQYFVSRQAAVDGVKFALAHHAQSVDVGCMQVNLQYHPMAFRTLPEAFDPAINARYAAQFLRGLWLESGEKTWTTAVGYYHSRTPDLAEAYRQMVAAWHPTGMVVAQARWR